MDFQTFFKKYSKKDKQMPLPADINEQVEDCLSVQVHTSGARPSFTRIGRGGKVKPKNYNKKFDDIFATRILNRHPNENEAQYNWRLSVYAPVAKELYDRFLTMCRGTILQPNSYDLSVDERTEEYIKGNYVYRTLYEFIPFILENPSAYMAVIEADIEEKDETSSLTPTIIFIKPEDLIMADDESYAFRYKDYVVFIDDEIQVIIDKDETYQFTHNFGKKPVWKLDNNFLEPFVAWADLLVRNMNDDEIMTKNYSYPIIQSVEPKCNAVGCVGGLVTNMDDINNPIQEKCGSCKGTGVMSRNPGDNYTISEEELYRNGFQMYDTVKFHTPDIGIPKYHLDRWQVFYDRTEKSLNLNKKINATESGDAKREDRKDQYFYLMAISNFVFENLKIGIEYLSAYLNYNQNTKSFNKEEVVLIAPKQFDLMTDSDLIIEFADMQKKTDDTQLLSEMQYQVNRRLYRTDKVQLMINEILYYNDELYGISGDALKAKMLSGVYTTRDKVVHEKGYRVLMQMSYEMTAKVFEDAEYNTLLAKFNERIDALIPKNIYSEI